MPGKIPSNFMYVPTGNNGMGVYYDTDDKLYPVSDFKIHEALFAYSDAGEFETLAMEFQSGGMSLAAWQTEMRVLIKDGHLNAVALERGGWDNMTAVDFGRAGGFIGSQYKYLDGWAAEIAAGTAPLDGRFLARAKMYQNSVYRTYTKAQKVTAMANGFVQRRSLLDKLVAFEDHCDLCVAAQAMGWMAIDDPALPDIGDRTCLTNDRCTMEYRTQEEADAAALQDIEDAKGLADLAELTGVETPKADSADLVMAHNKAVADWISAYANWGVHGGSTYDMLSAYNAAIEAGLYPDMYVNITGSGKVIIKQHIESGHDLGKWWGIAQEAETWQLAQEFDALNLPDDFDMELANVIKQYSEGAFLTEKELYDAVKKSIAAGHDPLAYVNPDTAIGSLVVTITDMVNISDDPWNEPEDHYAISEFTDAVESHWKGDISEDELFEAVGKALGAGYLPEDYVDQETKIGMAVMDMSEKLQTDGMVADVPGMPGWPSVEAPKYVPPMTDAAKEEQAMSKFADDVESYLAGDIGEEVLWAAVQETLDEGVNPASYMDEETEVGQLVMEMVSVANTGGGPMYEEPGTYISEFETMTIGEALDNLTLTHGESSPLYDITKAMMYYEKGVLTANEFQLAAAKAGEQNIYVLGLMDTNHPAYNLTKIVSDYTDKTDEVWTPGASLDTVESLATTAAEGTSAIYSDEWDKTYTHYKSTGMTSGEAQNEAALSADAAAAAFAEDVDIQVPQKYSNSYAASVAYEKSYKAALVKYAYATNSEAVGSWALSDAISVADHELKMEISQASPAYVPGHEPVELYIPTEEVKEKAHAKAWEQHYEIALDKVSHENQVDNLGMTAFEVEVLAAEQTDMAMESGDLDTEIQDWLEKLYVPSDELIGFSVAQTELAKEVAWQNLFDKKLLAAQEHNALVGGGLSGEQMYTQAIADADLVQAQGGLDYAVKEILAKSITPNYYKEYLESNSVKMAAIFEPTESEMDDAYQAWYKKSFEKYKIEAQTTPMSFQQIESLAKGDADYALEVGWIKTELVNANTAAIPNAPPIPMLEPNGYDHYENFIGGLSTSDYEDHKMFLVENQFNVKLTAAEKYHLTTFDHDPYYKFVETGRKGYYKPVEAADVDISISLRRAGNIEGQEMSETDQRAVILEWYERGQRVTYHGNVTDAKHYAVSRLAGTSGVSYESADKFVAQWANTSNGSGYTSMFIQNQAGEIFDVDMSKWQSRQFASATRDRQAEIEAGGHQAPSTRMIAEDPDNTGKTKERNFDTPEAANEALIRAVYKNTQDELDVLREAGVTHVTLYRGIRPRTTERRPDRGDYSGADSNALESFAIKEDKAGKLFGWGNTGRVMKIRVPLERVYSTARTGIGCLDEYEWVIIKNDDDLFWIMDKEY